MDIKLSYIAPISTANGPGARYTLWVQGCSIHCPGCHNKDTWDPAKGFSTSVDALIKDIQTIDGLDGITITGGEPLDQYEAVYELCSSLFRKKSIFLTTGYTFEQVYYKQKFKIMSVLDIVCVGPFERDKICNGGWRGSENQDVMSFTELGDQQLLLPEVSKEIIVNKSGSILTTGFHP
jgi:anaerobic ribonucleoside-triphosphate reductase activating protein